MPKAPPGFEEEGGRARTRNLEDSVSITAFWSEQPLGLGHIPARGTELVSRSPTLTSQVPPANGHQALEQRFAGILTSCGHTMEPDEQHPVAMLLIAPGA